MKNTKNKLMLAGILILGLSTNLYAEKGAEALMKKNKPKEGTRLAEAGTIMTGHGNTLKSGMKSLGVIGKEGKYEVIQVKIRGLDSPNITAMLIVNTKTEEIEVVQTAGGSGLGGTIIAGGSFVAGSYLHQAKRGPDTTEVNASGGSSGTSTINNTATSSSTGGSIGGVTTGNGNNNGPR